MRYTHGCKPRNPYNMIIQENHAVDRATIIIPQLATNKEIKEGQNPLYAARHDMRKYFTE